MNPSSRMVFLFFAVEFRFGLMETIRVIERCVQDVKRSVFENSSVSSL